MRTVNGDLVEIVEDRREDGSLQAALNALPDNLIEFEDINPVAYCMDIPKPIKASGFTVNPAGSNLPIVNLRIDSDFIVRQINIPDTSSRVRFFTEGGLMLSQTGRSSSYRFGIIFLYEGHEYQIHLRQASRLNF